MIYEAKVMKAFGSYSTSANTRYKLGNQVLYDLCKQHPTHTDADEIVAKIWLIGRSYAAAIERRKTADSFDGDFYYDVAAPAIIKAGNSIDNHISSLAGLELNDANLDVVLNLHGELMGVFENITDMNKRSLASKYLHFHCPDLFFIYDSRASNAITKLVRKGKETLYRHISAGRDMTYTDFCVRALELRDYIEKESKVKLSPRELDTLLLSYKE